MSEESRYEEAPEEFNKLVRVVCKNHVPSLKKAKIKCLLDTKSKKTKGRYRLAELRLPDDFVKYFSSLAEDDMSSPDFLMIFDKGLYHAIEKKDKKRIIFHELNHGFIDEDGKCKILPHDFEGFHAEVEYNKDDPEWNIRMANEMEILYEDR